MLKHTYKNFLNFGEEEDLLSSGVQHRERAILAPNFTSCSYFLLKDL